MFRAITEQLVSALVDRVTRLGEFAPIVLLFTLGSFLITGAYPIFGLLFTTSYICIYFDKNGLAYTMGSFFTTHQITLLVVPK
jgi:hypothetical protein